MHLGIKNLSVEPVPLVDAAGQWGQLLLLGVGLDLDKPGTIWLIGRKLPWRERVREILADMGEAFAGYFRDTSLEDHDAGSNAECVRVQINNKSGATVLVVLGSERQKDALIPGAIEVYEADHWIEIREISEIEWPHSQGI